MNKLFIMLALLGLTGSVESKTKTSIELNGILYEDHVGELIQHSVVVEGQEQGSSEWHKIGSGSVISTDKGPAILTAFHVISDIPMGITYRACSVLDVDRSGCVLMNSMPRSDMDDPGLSGDWALFLIPNIPESSTIAAVRTTPIIIGEDIWAVGSPASATGLVTHGIITGFEQHENKYVLISDAFIYFGSSGGALYDKNGELVGIIVAMENSGNQFLQFPLPQFNFSVSTYFIDQSLVDISFDTSKRD